MNSLLELQDSELVYEVEVAGPPLCILRNGIDGGKLEGFLWIVLPLLI